MNKKYQIIYQTKLYCHYRYTPFGFNCETEETEEIYHGALYSTKEKLLKSNPNALTEEELLKQYNASNLCDLPDGRYLFYTEEKLY